MRLKSLPSTHEADQIYGDEEMHNVVRAMCMDYMAKERDHFSQFITEDFEAYISRKREDKCYGNNVEMQAFTEVFGRPIEVYSGRGDGLYCYSYILY